MTSLFRICDRRYHPEDPTGATRFPGRWHAIGQPVLYFSSSLALAVLELRANGVPFALLREAFHYSQIDVPLNRVDFEAVPPSFFSFDWAHQIDRSRAYGTAWHNELRTQFLKVSSAALSSEMNYVLNAKHAGFAAIRFSKPKPIPLDARL